MPNVAGKKFPYTASGMKKAKMMAKKMGKPMKMRKKGSPKSGEKSYGKKKK